MAAMTSAQTSASLGALQGQSRWRAARPFWHSLRRRDSLGSRGSAQAVVSARSQRSPDPGDASPLSPEARKSAVLLTRLLASEHAYTATHSSAVVALAQAVAVELGLDSATRERVAIAALLHDVGKVVIPTEILDKPAPLSAAELALIKRHTLTGAAIIERAHPELRPVAAIVAASHERWDGSGYPRRLRGEEIPLEARIVFACDAYDAMTSTRAYRRPLRAAEALREIERHAGSQFDPRVAAALVAVVERSRGL